MTARLRSSALMFLLLLPPVGLVAGVPSATASSETPKRPARVDLKGSTVVTGSRPTAIDVHVARDAAIRDPFVYTKQPGVEIRGGGRFASFALVQQPSSQGSRTFPLAIVGARLPKQAQSRLVLLPLGTTDEEWASFTEDGLIQVPAGDYRLFLVPGGRSATAIIKLDGVKGSVALTPTRRVDATVKFPEPRLLGGLANNVYSAGDTAELSSAGLAFSVLWLKVDAHVAGEYERCLYLEEEPPEPLAYGPGCPQASDLWAAHDALVIPFPHQKIFLVGTIPVQPGSVGQGWWFSSAAAVESRGSVALWLPFD